MVKIRPRVHFYRAIWYSQWRLNEALWIGLVGLFCWAVGNPTEMRSRSLYTSIVDPESSGIRGGRKGKTYIRSRICPLSFFSFPTTPRSWRAMWGPSYACRCIEYQVSQAFSNRPVYSRSGCHEGWAWRSEKIFISLFQNRKE